MKNDPTVERLLELSAGLGLVHEQLERLSSALVRRDVRTAALACTAIRASVVQLAATRELLLGLAHDLASDAVEDRPCLP